MTSRDMGVLWLVLAAIAQFATANLQGSSWSYEGDVGTGSWSKKFPTCGGNEQSPVDLLSSCTYQPFSAFSGGVVSAVSGITNIKLRNVGYTVALTVPYITTVSGGGLDGVYNLDSVHFHWGNSSDRGSEHTFGGKRFPMELHVITYKNSYVNLSAALTSTDRMAVAILGVIVEVGSSSVLSSTVIDIVQDLSYIANPGTSVDIYLSLTNLAQAFQKILENSPFYRYLGSLTTPGCNQQAIWTVFKNKVALTESQLTAFRRLQFATGLPMVDNYRLTQSINGRTVYCSSPDLVSSGSTTHYGSRVLLTKLWVSVAMLLHSSRTYAGHADIKLGR